MKPDCREGGEMLNYNVILKRLTCIPYMVRTT